ncbi:putative leader peptide [Streptomyces sp. NPDC056716]|uniref:putative leader peptide n=1 Tax=Streptomyces sp. NPDC056716 TaxID=3345922 RepID=UPI0036A90A92
MAACAPGPYCLLKQPVHARSHMVGSRLPSPRHPCQAAVTPPEQVRREPSERSVAMSQTAVLLLTVRRHVDLGRVSSAVCR